MSEKLEAENAAIEAASPALARLLSPLGRRASFPPGIPFQEAAARGKTFNATIGQVTDGEGHALVLEPMAAAFAGLAEDDRNRAFLYSPMAGLPELRARWRDRHLRIAFCSVRGAALNGLVERLATGVEELQTRTTRV